MLTLTAPQPYAYLLEGSSTIYLVCEAGLDDRSLLRGRACSPAVVTGLVELDLHR